MLFIGHIKADFDDCISKQDRDEEANRNRCLFRIHDFESRVIGCGLGREISKTWIGINLQNAHW